MFTRIVKRLPGYHPIAAGTVANIGALRSLALLTQLEQQT
jgi:hypothetical protein